MALVALVILWNAMATSTRHQSPPLSSSSEDERLVRRPVAFSRDQWHDLHLQAALEGKPGRGDIVRKAVTLYLAQTRGQRP